MLLNIWLWLNNKKVTVISGWIWKYNLEVASATFSFSYSQTIVLASPSSPTLKLLALKESTFASEDEQDEQDCKQYYDAFSEAKERVIHLF